MATHLTAQLFESHGAGWPEAGRPVRLRMDQVLLEEEDGLVTLLAFESLARARHGAEIAAVVLAREASGPDALDDQRYLQEAAAAIGATFVRPGAGPVAAVHRRAFARPGRTLLCSAPGAGGAGAFAMLALAATATESAAVLAGEPLWLARPVAIGVRLVGELPAGAGGAEIVESLARALEQSARGAVLEFFGEPLRALRGPERVALAALAPVRLGALAAVMPSDDVTRGMLAACDRDADWRRLEGDGHGFERTITFDLSRVRRGAAAPERVRVGPFATDDELRALAAMPEHVSLAAFEIVPGGRAARRALAEELEQLAARGAAVLDAADPRALAPLDPGMPAIGADDEVSAGRAEPASVDGVLARLGLPAASWTPAAPRSQALAAAERIAPAPGAPAPARGPGHVVPRLPEPPAGSPRGPVLWRAEGDAPLDRVLPYGPRAQVRRGDPTSLAAAAFRDGDLATGTGQTRWGVAVATGHWGGGAHSDAAARALVARGVRVVIARSFAAADARALAVHGVLPLAWRRTRDAEGLAPGDEVELPGIADALARGGRTTLRVLTRGTSFDATPAVDAEWLAVVRAGGWLAACAHAGAEA